MDAIPAGFKPIFRLSEYTELIGPIYSCESEEGIRVGMRFEKKHANRRGMGHGAVVSALADIAMGYRLAFSQTPPLPVVTVNLSLDFMGQIEIGQWAEVKVVIDKLGRSIAFARCEFMVDDRCVARASGVFKVVQPSANNEESANEQTV